MAAFGNNNVQSVRQGPDGSWYYGDQRVSDSTVYTRPTQHSDESIPPGSQLELSVSAIVDRKLGGIFDELHSEWQTNNDGLYTQTFKLKNHLNAGNHRITEVDDPMDEGDAVNSRFLREELFSLEERIRRDLQTMIQEILTEKLESKGIEVLRSRVLNFQLNKE